MKRETKQKISKGLYYALLCLCVGACADTMYSAVRTAPYYRSKSKLAARADSLRTVIRIADAIAALDGDGAAKNTSADAARELRNVDSMYQDAVRHCKENDSYFSRMLDKVSGITR